jgi:hypothetical protein
MSGKVHKKIRKVALKVADNRFKQMIRQIGLMPLRHRVRFALKILKGAKK